MRAGIETLKIMEEDGLLANATTVGNALGSALSEAFKGNPGVVDIRGQGLMIGIELDRPCGELLGRAAEAGLLISVTADKVVRLLPSLIMTTAEAQEVVDILVPLIRDFLARPVTPAPAKP
jgi:acetylornithine/N-succinyldiaminopimelate aminotransferase